MSQSDNDQFSSTFVKMIDLKLADKLKEDLISQGFEISTPPHTLFSAKKKGVSCTLYTSGKLTVQGKDKADFISFYLEPEIFKDLSFTHPETKVDLVEHIGIDEAGKGDFFGPLCVAGVCAGGDTLKKLLELGVRDSKKLSDTTILKLATRIKSTAPHHVIRIFPKKYNELYQSFKDLNKLLAWGHAATIEELVRSTQCKKVIIDQFASEHIVENALKKKNLEVELTQRHRGEEDPVVAAASILARAAFLEGMQQLSQMAGLELPKGASQQVIDAAKKLILKHGQPALEKYAKLHFKTLDKVLSEE
ncbi:MAG TPA: ribonuclease HIII [Rhabdochlamydiaceae bacterium]|nr:ribonuclease HIII [Rhabdochlamydiaceae bacterium]